VYSLTAISPTPQSSQPPSPAPGRLAAGATGKHRLQTPVCVCDHRRVPAADYPSVVLTLSPAQVELVVATAVRERRAVARARAVVRRARADAGVDVDDARLSRSLLRGLTLLDCFEGDAGEQGILELARRLGMSPSTAHRYAQTLLAVGLLQRCPRTRRYRLAAGSAGEGAAAPTGRAVGASGSPAGGHDERHDHQPDEGDEDGENHRPRR
jgi:hypothetical protein